MNKEQLEYLKQKINGIRNNPKRCMHEILNFIQGKLIAMTHENISDADYWKAWSDANIGINTAISHFNSETDLGRRLTQIFLFVQSKLREKPTNELIFELCGIIKTIKDGFKD